MNLFDCVPGLGTVSIMVFTDMAIIDIDQVQVPAMKYVLKM